MFVRNLMSECLVSGGSSLCAVCVIHRSVWALCSMFLRFSIEMDSCGRSYIFMVLRQRFCIQPLLPMKSSQVVMQWLAEPWGRYRK